MDLIPLTDVCLYTIGYIGDSLQWYKLPIWPDSDFTLEIRSNYWNHWRYCQCRTGMKSKPDLMIPYFSYNPSFLPHWFVSFMFYKPVECEISTSFSTSLFIPPFRLLLGLAGTSLGIVPVSSRLNLVYEISEGRIRLWGQDFQNRYLVRSLILYLGTRTARCSALS